MGIKKHSWMRYGRQGEIIEIVIKDSSHSKIDFFRCNNKKDYKKIIKLIRQKYGYSPFEDESKDENKVLEKDFEW